MSSNRNDIILTEYIGLLREMVTNHNTLILSYSRFSETISAQLSQLIRDSFNNNINNNNTQHIRSNNSNTQTTRQGHQQWNSWGQNTNTQNRNERIRWDINPNRRNTTRTRAYEAPTRRYRYRDSDWISGSNSRNRQGLRRQNLVNQILTNSLYTSTSRQPATAQDISNNSLIHNWSDIRSTTDQTICPITQEQFHMNDNVMRINHCGHVFAHDALTTYFSEFDHRCPICRYSIRSELIPPSLNRTRSASYVTQTTNTQDISSNTNSNSPHVNLTRNNSFWDVSFNFLNSTEINNTLGDMNMNNAISQLSTAMASQLSTAMNNPDNSGNLISAEYSLFIPQNFTDNTTNN